MHFAACETACLKEVITVPGSVSCRATSSAKSHVTRTVVTRAKVKTRLASAIKSGAMQIAINALSGANPPLGGPTWAFACDLAIIVKAIIVTSNAVMAG